MARTKAPVESQATARILLLDERSAGLSLYWPSRVPRRSGLQQQIVKKIRRNPTNAKPAESQARTNKDVPNDAFTLRSGRLSLITDEKIEKRTVATTAWPTEKSAAMKEITVAKKLPQRDM